MYQRGLIFPTLIFFSISWGVGDHSPSQLGSWSEWYVKSIKPCREAIWQVSEGPYHTAFVPWWVDHFSIFFPTKTLSGKFYYFSFLFFNPSLTCILSTFIELPCSPTIDIFSSGVQKFSKKKSYIQGCNIEIKTLMICQSQPGQIYLIRPYFKWSSTIKWVQPSQLTFTSLLWPAQCAEALVPFVYQSWSTACILDINTLEVHKTHVYNLEK